MALHFSKEEFSKRKTEVLKSMKNQNIDALLMFRQESMYWLTGYDTFGYVFFQTLILDKNGNIILLTRAPDLRQAQNTSNIKDIRILDQGFEYASDKTLRPEALISPLLTLVDNTEITSVEVLDGGKNYTSAPNIVIYNPSTDEIVNSGYLKANTYSNSVSNEY